MTIGHRVQNNAQRKIMIVAWQLTESAPDRMNVSHRHRHRPCKARAETAPRTRLPGFASKTESVKRLLCDVKVELKWNFVMLWVTINIKKIENCFDEMAQGRWLLRCHSCRTRIVYFIN